MFRQEKRVDQAMAWIANGATSVALLRHHDVVAPTRRGLFFKGQLQLLTGNAKRLGR